MTQSTSWKKLKYIFLKRLKFESISPLTLTLMRLTVSPLNHAKSKNVSSWLFKGMWYDYIVSDEEDASYPIHPNCILTCKRWTLPSPATLVKVELTNFFGGKNEQVNWEAGLWRPVKIVVTVYNSLINGLTITTHAQVQCDKVCNDNW